MAQKEPDRFLGVKQSKFRQLLEKKGITIEHGIFLNVKGEDSQLVRDIEGFLTIIQMLVPDDAEYLIINRDEPYAQAFWDIIIAFEKKKELLAEFAQASNTPICTKSDKNGECTDTAHPRTLCAGINTECGHYRPPEAQAK